MLWRILLGVAVLASVVSGCSGISGMKTQVDYDRDADFTRLKTWDWLPGEPRPTGYRGLDDPAVVARLQGAIGDALKDRGCQQSTVEPDFYVVFNLAFTEEINARNIENYYQYINYAVFAPYVTSSYTEVFDIGTLIVDVLDRRAKTHVWRGAAQTKVNAQAGPRENEPKLREAARRIFQDFPPGK
jgi:hypothetical protein